MSDDRPKRGDKTDFVEISITFKCIVPIGYEGEGAESLLYEMRGVDLSPEDLCYNAAPEDTTWDDVHLDWGGVNLCEGA